MKNLLWSLCLVVVASSFTSASAATKTWTGATDANWSTSGNWSPAGAPTTGDDLVFPVGGANQLTTTNDLTAGTSFSSITISGGGYSISGNAIILTSTNAVSVTSGATVGQFIGLGISFTNAAATVNTQAPTGYLSLGGTLTTPTGGTLNLSTITTIIYPNAVDGLGGLSTSGAGQVILQGVATHTGTTTVSGPGQFYVDSGAGLSDSGVVDVAAGGTFSLLQDETIGTLTGAGIVNIINLTLTIAGPASSNFSGELQGSGIVDLKDQFGLAGNSPTFTGTINVNSAGGWLQSSGFNGPTTNVTANNSISIYLDSTFRSITTNSSFEPGALSGGSLADVTINSNLELQSGGNFTVYPNSSNSHGAVNVGGTVTITSTNLDMTNANGFNPSASGPVMTIINKTSSGAVSGTFTSRPEGAVFTPTGTSQPYRITYLGGDGNDVVLCPDTAGFDAVCAPIAVVPVDGVCGTAAGVAVSSAPSSNLCAAGTATAVSLVVLDYTWSCNGLLGGANISCAAPYSLTAPAPASDNGDSNECKKPKSAPRNLSVQKLTTGVRAIWDAPKAKRSVTVEYTNAAGKKSRAYVKKASDGAVVLPVGAHDIRAALKNSCGKGDWTSKKNYVGHVTLIKQ